ncbi:translation initiation factor eIF-2B subunit gamma [Fusarium oxysporum f. sp. radicis-lycopersici 26381]|uniref:Translation initiation factor eIF2B subunit gamma n=1 Tax=Fusarium oxysporum Fo47 TaxID=660027 RepID=W9KYA4_FUSOX|nr:nucleotide-diphospho-sugar transferase [Fusarium oxysporum Fo47]EWZ49472.1 translation initiation factor eIF-2B subunit gamma [Fusarium oxysporum Fo47]EXL46284.1 translation initiation factor eIF-2B subunit gamma [Fusarium oxysporum f. sp. radicis-lycopersici 26381]QKD48206.2 nucleotide-diphospho-sugar transferase [Fusarium oxysporum Fo47]
MPHAVSMPSTGLQALILCGPGSSFPTFTSNPDESPKALLPIANRPMVWYALDFCYRMGITDINLVCPPTASEAISTALNTNLHLTALPLPRPDILSPVDLDQNTGTAEILRLPEIRKIITGDFVVLPCDLVCELGGDKLLQSWMVKSASLTDMLGTARLSNGHRSVHSGALGVWYDTKAVAPVKKEETDFIATTPLPSSPVTPSKGSLFSNLSKLVYSMPTDSLRDLTEDKGSLPIRHGLLRAHSRVRMFTTHRDAHIYIFPRWVLDFVKDNERMESIGEDVVGWWAKAGWQSGLAEKLNLESACAQGRVEETKDDERPSSPSRVSTPDNIRSDWNTYGDTAAETSVPSIAVDDGPSAAEKSTSFQVPPIVAYVHPGGSSAPLIRRVDTAQLLLAISLQLAKLPSLEETGGESPSPYAHAKKIAYPEGVKARTTITQKDSLIAENVTVEEKTSIKETVIGAGSQINEGAKLSQCLLMEGVVVGKACKLTRCIIGKRAVIGDGSVLTDCEVQENLLVEARTEDKDNKLMSSEGLEATEAEMEEVLQDMEADAEQAVMD